MLKFGINEAINKEYLISEQLKELPNFIRYFCIIVCNDEIKNIINEKGNIMNYKICNNGDNKVGILIMKHYILGNIGEYEWNEDNFYILINVIKALSS